MEPFERRRAVGGLAVMAGITLDDEEIDAVDGARLDGRRRQSGSYRQLHAERFVEDYALETLDGRLEDVSTWRAPERHGNLAAFDAHGDLVLRASEGQPYARVAREQWSLGQFPQDVC